MKTKLWDKIDNAKQFNSNVPIVVERVKKKLERKYVS